eukprot:scaffold3827_cov179-Cylindrotheca_fusiformis.AAC.1
MSADQKIGSPVHGAGSFSVKASSAARIPEVQYTFAGHNLAEKLVGDVVIGTGVTFAVAPFLTVVDKAIVQSAAGTHNLLRSAFESVQGMFLHPVKYVKSPTFLLMWGIYAGTYSTANSLKTLVEHQSYKNAVRSDRDSSMSRNDSEDLGKAGIFLGTTFVNSGLSLLKDRTYARLYGSNPVQVSVPRLTYAMWMARDLSVVGSSFVLPDLVYPKVMDTYGLDEAAAKGVCQLALPMGAQLVAGPLHYLGLDIYNRNLNSKTWYEAVVDRSKSLYRGVTPVIIARIARIAPGYGFGGVMNTKCRDNWRDYLLQREVKRIMAQPKKENASRLVALVHGLTGVRPSSSRDRPIF